jgi:hypothetical protein
MSLMAEGGQQRKRRWFTRISGGVLRVHRQFAPAEDDKLVFRHRAKISIGENMMPDGRAPARDGHAGRNRCGNIITLFLVVPYAAEATTEAAHKQKAIKHKLYIMLCRVTSRA